MRKPLVAALAVTFLLPALGSAQTAAPPTASAADTAALTRAAQEAAEDLVLTKVFAGLRLTDAQLRELLPVLQQAQARLQALDRENAETLNRHRTALQEARDQLLAGQAVSPRAETQYAEARALAETKRAQLRTDLIATLKRALATHLGPQQEALILQTAQAVSFQQRTAGFRAMAVTGDRGGGGGPSDWTGRMMDRMRSMSPQEYQRERERIAQRMAGRGGGQGGQDVQRYLAMMDQVRSMAANTYQQQRAELGLQVFAQMADRRRGQETDPRVEVDRFIERYFLSPRVVPLVQQRVAGTMP